LQRDEPLRLTTGFPQAGKVGLHIPICLEQLERCVKNRSRSYISRSLDSVVHPLTLSPRLYDPGTAQVGKMPGDLRLALLENLHEVADADLPAIHKIQQPQARWVGKCREQLHQIERFGGSAH
jgi:hypothetical protein